MAEVIDIGAVDYLVFSVINIVNVLMFFSFAARMDRPDMERKLLIAVTAMAVPALAAIVMYAVEEYSWWHWAVPLVFVVWAVMEFAVDVIAKLEFKHPHDLKIIIPFIVVFHLSLVGMWFLTWEMGMAFWVTTAVFYAVHIGGMLYAQFRGGR
jgi:hypothetical protein